MKWGFYFVYFVSLHLPLYFRQKGFQGGKKTSNSKFGNVTSQFSMDDVVCTGREKYILDCPHNTNDNCGPHEGAGVICDGN